MHEVLGVLGVGLLLASCGGKAELSESNAGSAGDAGSGGATGGSGGAIAGGSGGTAGTSGTGGQATGGTGGTTIVPPPDQAILFEVSNENYAWGATLDGFFITVEGDVFVYDFYAGNPSGEMPPYAAQHMTEQELRERWGTVTPGPVAKVPVDELLTWHASLGSIAQGILLRDWVCADAGDRTYLGYLYDPATKLYSRVVAGVDGDLAARNLAAEAEGLVAWLADVAGIDRYCVFQGVECTGAMCNTPSPACEPGQVPSVVNGCWGDCVPASRCLQVDDCSWCGGQVCATSGAQTYHCPFNYCAGPPCQCPTNPCGGGEDVCSGNFSEIRCTAF